VDRSACSVTKLRSALRDQRVSAGQRAQIRAALRVAASAGPEALCLAAQPAGAGTPAAPVVARKGCRVSDLAAAVASGRLPANVREQAQRQLRVARQGGVTSLCAGPAPRGNSHRAPAPSADPRACSIEAYRRALRAPQLTAAQRDQIRAYLEMLKAQHRAQPYC
jgi:hypothetical protein